MTRTSRAFMVFASLLALLAGGAYFLLRGDGQGWLNESGSRRPTPVEESSAPVPETAAAREPEEAPPAAEASHVAPPSYLAALGGFTGRLLEPELTPTKGLKVSAVEFELSNFLLESASLLEATHAPPALESAHAISDDEGRFVLTGLEPRAIHLLGIDLGGPRGTFRVVDRNAISGEMVDLGDIVLEPFVTFVGRVLDEDAAPVVGARVRATNLPAMILQFGIEDIRRGCGVMVALMEGEAKAFDVPPIVWQFETLLPIPTTLTDDEGRFTLPGVPLGMVSVVADKAGFKGVVKSQPSGKAPKRSVGDLILTPGFALGGVIVNGSGEPVADVEVLAGIRDPAIPVDVALLQPAGRTDARGAFRVTGLPSGEKAYVATRASRGQPWRVHGPLPAAESGLHVQLAPPSGFVVTLRDDAGRPVLDAELFIAPDPLEGGAPVPPIFAPPMQRLNEVTDEGDGVKRVTGLDAGKYQLIGRAEGYALATASVTVADPPPPCELVFTGANAVDVVVVRAKDRQPLEWAFASLAPKGAFERPVARARSNEEGKLRLTRIPAGEYVLSVHHPAQATRDVEVTVPVSEPITVELVVGGNLKGRIVERGHPPGRSLFLVLTMDEAKGVSDALPTLTASVETGEFAAPNLAAGDYHLEVRDRVIGKGPFALFQTMRDDPLARAQFTIREGETTEIVIDAGAEDGPAAELFGSVWLNGAPAPDVSVRVEGPKNRTVKTDAAGNYRFESLPAAACSLLVQGLKEGDLFSIASVVHREELDLSTGGSRRVDIVLRVAAVRGRITGPGSLPAGPGTMVILRGSEGSSTQLASTNPLTGSYEFPFVAAGKFDLLVRRSGAAPFTTTIEVDPGRGDVEQDVRLVPSISVRGKIVLPEYAAEEGDEVRGSTLVLVDAEGRPAGRGRIDWKTREYTIDDATPGEYTAQIFRRDQTLVSHHVVVPTGGSSNLTLAFELPAEGEKVLPLPTGRGRQERRRDGN